MNRQHWQDYLLAFPYRLRMLPALQVFSTRKPLNLRDSGRPDSTVNIATYEDFPIQNFQLRSRYLS